MITNKLSSAVVIVLLLCLQVESGSVDDELCDKQLEYFRKSLRSNPREKWALQSERLNTNFFLAQTSFLISVLKVFDYWAKIQSGLSAGQSQNFGHFDECVAFTHTPPSMASIQGQHCMVFHAATDEPSNDTEWNEDFDWREL
jgi:hypothetical protein